jgi:carboxymethylenebutenolidase
MSTTEMVSYRGDTVDTLTGYMARPDGYGPFPAVVVIHEAFGLNDDIRSVADRFAGEGYAALAVDLFAGRNRVMCIFRFFGGLLMNSLEHDGIKNLRKTLDYVGGLPFVDSNKVGAIGFCMGGSFSIAWACTDDRLKAVAPYYAMNPRPMEAVARSCPVVGSYPENDFTKSAGQALDMTLDKYGIAHDIKVYPNAGHSFFNRTRSRYNPDAANDSWERVLAFFNTHLSL